ncbi:hypothetical protein PV762_07995 [Mitsuaria sp. CC2]|uniref:MOSC domain-containing protein n=1 Tax=Mitsuaria sp. CC2 TaxID=3029186 RepID=UPI003B8AAD3B
MRKPSLDGPQSCHELGVGGSTGQPGDAHWQTIGKVTGLFVRGPRDSCARPQSSLQLIKHLGAVGDRHASPRSPRQLLIAGQPAYERLNLPSNTLRENLLVDVPTDDLNSGDLLAIGPDVVLWLTFQCEPCSRLERRSPGLLRSMGSSRGVLARVVRGGTLTRGDQMRYARSAIPAMSEKWQARVIRVLHAVPPDCCISYRQLAEFAGVATGYCRAFPRLLSTLPSDIASRAQSGLPPNRSSSWEGAELFDVAAHLDQVIRSSGSTMPKAVPPAAGG